MCPEAFTKNKFTCFDQTHMEINAIQVKQFGHHVNQIMLIHES